MRKDRLAARKKFTGRASGGWCKKVLIYRGMSAPLSKIVTLACAVLVLGTATTASARPKKQSAQSTSASAVMCDGTPVIMKGMECSRPPVRAEAQEPAAERPPRPRLSARGSSGGYVAPVQRPPSLTLSQPSTGVYIPPPVNNPSERINQLNQSFPLNGGLGNNPTNRDAYIRYNFNR